MASEKVYGFNEEGFRRVREAVRRVLGSPKTGSQQRRQVPVVGGGCNGRNEIWQLIVFGSPTGGTFNLVPNVKGTSDTLTFNFDDDATEVETEFLTHTNIASGDVEITGGPLPGTTVNIEFKGDLKNTRIPVPTIEFGSLTGGTGAGIVVARWQPGHPIDGSVAP